MSNRAPWDPRKTETPEQAAMFGAFLATPPGTSVHSFAIENGYSQSRIADMAGRHEWRARKAAFHHALVREQLEAAKDAARARGEAQANFLADLRDYAHKALLDHVTSGRKATLKDVIAAGKVAIELERLVHGQSTQNVKLDYEGTIDELAHAEEVLLKLRPKEA